jgi:hypothetical protein
MQDLEVEKEKAVQMIAENEKRQDQAAQKRQDEWDKRDQKMKNAMGRMADTVLKKNNEAEKVIEKRALQYALEKDKREENAEKQKKQATRQRDIDIKRTLDQQIQERNQTKVDEMEKNKVFIQMVLDRDEFDKRT